MLRGVGLGFRPEIAPDLLQNAHEVGFVEFVAEAHLASGSEREAIAASRIFPSALHGVKLSLGSADGIDEDHARQIGSLARKLRAAVISEHISFTKSSAIEIGHLTPLPRTRETVRILARNLDRARRYFPDVPILLENIACPFEWTKSDLCEIDFLHEVLEHTGCFLLLDVSNLYANAVNAGRDPMADLCRLPLERVAMLHVAGGEWANGFYYDTHAHPMSNAIVELVHEVKRLIGDVPTLLERDGNFSSFQSLVGELASLRTPFAKPFGGATAKRNLPEGYEDPSELLAAQRLLARSLTSSDNRAAALLREGLIGLERGRSVLLRKRVDDALPLIPTLARLGDRLRTIADGCIQQAPRSPRRVAVADALIIAQTCARDPLLRGDAERDLAVLRARFHETADGPVPRRAPFLTCVGRTLIAKNLGETARVRILDFR